MRIDVNNLAFTLLLAINSGVAAQTGSDLREVDPWQRESLRLDLARAFGGSPKDDVIDTDTCADPIQGEDFVPSPAALKAHGDYLFKAIGLNEGSLDHSVTVGLVPNNTGEGMGVYSRAESWAVFPPHVDLAVSVRRSDSGGLALPPEELVILLRQLADSIEHNPSFVRPANIGIGDDEQKGKGE